jgi:hypothetical protein
VAKEQVPFDWRRFPCALGDVVVRTADGAEAWLAGAIVLREDAPVAALFVAPEAKSAGGDRAVYARVRPSQDLAWLAPLAAEVADAAGLSGVAGEPPSAIEIDGVRFQRSRRLPLRAERVGKGAPHVGATALIGEYGAPSGDVAIVLMSDGAVHAWRGARLVPGEYDVWRGSERTEGSSARAPAGKRR